MTQEDEGGEAQEVAYAHIRRTIQDVQNLSRYHGLRAALSMLALQVCSQPQSACASISGCFWVQTLLCYDA